MPSRRAEPPRCQCCIRPAYALHTPCIRPAYALHTPCIRDEPFRSSGRFNAMNQFTQSTDRTNTLRGIPVSVCAATEQINATCLLR